MRKVLHTNCNAFKGHVPGREAHSAINYYICLDVLPTQFRTSNGDETQQIEVKDSLDPVVVTRKQNVLYVLPAVAAANIGLNESIA